MDVNYVENIRYTGFIPYKDDPLVTKKPVGKSLYFKDYYNEISMNKNTKVGYFDKESRWKSSYNKLIIGSLDDFKKEDFSKKTINPLIEYDFCHLPLNNQVNNKTTKSQFTVRDRSSDQYKNMKSFYDFTNENVFKTLKENPSSKSSYYTKQVVPDIHVTKSRAFKSETFDSEYTKAFGKSNDNIKEKYFMTSNTMDNQIKPYSDYFEYAKGTNKLTTNPQGYTGFIPRNEFEFKDSMKNDSYSNQLKVNILGNIKENIPGYQGYRKNDSVVDRKLNENFFIDNNLSASQLSIK